MKTKPIYAALVAAAFVLPVTATAGGKDKSAAGTSASSTQSTDQSASQSAATPNRGASSQASFSSLDKNGDGSISKEELAGSAQESQFATLDKDGDGKLSRSEHASATGTLTSSTNRNSAST